MNGPEIAIWSAMAGALLVPGAAAAADTPPGISLDRPSPFSFDVLVGLAQGLAAKPYAATPVRGGDVLEKVDFDVYQQITFREDDTLFADAKYPVRLFHLGRYFKQPVRISIVADGQAYAFNAGGEARLIATMTGTMMTVTGREGIEG